MGVKKNVISFCLVSAVLFAGNALAAPFANPNPGLLADDIDGGGYFSHPGLNSNNDLIAAIELYDVLESVNSGGISFGLYFEGDPGNTYEIFDANDSINDIALVSFSTGAILDNETNDLQSYFAPNNANIGFYVSFLGMTLFSDPNLNSNSTDIAGVFPFLPGPDVAANSYLLLFNAIDPATNEIVTVASEVGVIGIEPVSPVPVPSTLLLLGTGLAGVGGFSWRKKRKV